MKTLEAISSFFGKYMAFIVLAVAALSLFVPQSTLWVQTGWINYLLMVVMFGMGLTLKLEDFKLVFTRPKDMLIGCVAQFTIMPLLAFALGKVFGLETALLAGVPDPCHGHGPGRHLLGLAQHFRCHPGQHLQPHERYVKTT